MDTPCNPQLEDGYTRVANELFDAIIRARLNRRQYAVLLAVTRKTYGYNRKTARISIRQVAAMTGLERSNVIRTINRLVKMSVLIRNEMPTSRDGAQVFEMGLNKHYDQWRFPGCGTDSDTRVETVSLVALPPDPDGCQNNTRLPAPQTGVKTTPLPSGGCQVDTRLPAPQVSVKAAPPRQTGAQTTYSPVNQRRSDTRPSDERSGDARDGCQNDTRLPPPQTGVKTTPLPSGGCQVDTRLPLPPDGCQNDTPPGVNLTPPTVKDKKIKDNTKTTTPLSATQTSPHLRRGEAEGAIAQPTTMPSECATDRGHPGVVELHRKTPTTFHVETQESHGVVFQGAVPTPASAVGSCLGVDPSDGHDADRSTGAAPNHAEDPGAEDAARDMDFALSPPHGNPGKRAGRRPRKSGDERFDRFWAAYPRKKSKMQAHRAFSHLAPSEDLLARILESLERAKKSSEWRREGGQYIPHPATWLRAQGWLDEFMADAYTPAQFAVLEQYNTILGEAGWPPAILAPYSVARASGIDDFIGFSPKPDMPERYFRYCAQELNPHDGCGFDWLIRRNVFLRIREGVIAKRETTRIPQWA